MNNTLEVLHLNGGSETWYIRFKNKETNAMSTVTLDKKTILVTGAAGFIGSNLVKRIYQEAPSATVIGIDNMNAYLIKSSISNTG